MVNELNLWPETESFLCLKETELSNVVTIYVS
jgi:hypothetical protein